MRICLQAYRLGFVDFLVRVAWLCRFVNAAKTHALQTPEFEGLQTKYTACIFVKTLKSRISGRRA